MLFNLQLQPSIGNLYIRELRDINIQQDKMRFRRNLERLGELFAYEISKTLPYQSVEVETPMGIAKCLVPNKPIVIASILRAGLPMHTGLLNVFSEAENAFVSAYRKHHKDGSFEIEVEYISCPPLDDKVLLIADPMLATGASIDLVTKHLLEHGTPSNIHVVTAIISSDGYQRIRRLYPQTHIWTGAIDEELTAKSYIVPGLGDAGDLAFGEKVQE